MIQRKQTIFLVAAIVLLVISAFNIEVVFEHAESGVLIASLSNFSLSDAHSSNHLYSVLGAMLIATSCLAAVAVFMFHNRKQQMRMCWWMIFVLLIYYIARMSCVISLAKYLKLSPNVDFYEAFPLLAMMFIILAYRGIRHDDKLVRDSYRIR